MHSHRYGDRNSVGKAEEKVCYMLSCPAVSARHALFVIFVPPQVAQHVEPVLSSLFMSLSVMSCT